MDSIIACKNVSFGYNGHSSGFAGTMGLRPFYSRIEKNTALNNMSSLKIVALKDRCFRKLSGGQQRRVLIARAFFAERV